MYVDVCTSLALEYSAGGLYAVSQIIASVGFLLVKCIVNMTARFWEYHTGFHLKADGRIC